MRARRLAPAMLGVVVEGQDASDYSPELDRGRSWSRRLGTHATLGMQLHSLTSATTRNAISAAPAASTRWLGRYCNRIGILDARPRSDGCQLRVERPVVSRER